MLISRKLKSVNVDYISSFMLQRNVIYLQLLKVLFSKRLKRFTAPFSNLPSVWSAGLSERETWLDRSDMGVFTISCVSRAGSQSTEPTQPLYNDLLRGNCSLQSQKVLRPPLTDLHAALTDVLTTFYSCLIDKYSNNRKWEIKQLKIYYGDC